MHQWRPCCERVCATAVTKRVAVWSAGALKEHKRHKTPNKQDPEHSHGPVEHCLVIVRFAYVRPSTPPPPRKFHMSNSFQGQISVREIPLSALIFAYLDETGTLSLGSRPLCLTFSAFWGSGGGGSCLGMGHGWWSLQGGGAGSLGGRPLPNLVVVRRGLCVWWAVESIPAILFGDEEIPWARARREWEEPLGVVCVPVARPEGGRPPALNWFRQGGWEAGWLNGLDGLAGRLNRDVFGKNDLPFFPPMRVVRKVDVVTCSPVQCPVVCVPRANGPCHEHEVPWRRHRRHTLEEDAV